MCAGSCKLTNSNSGLSSSRVFTRFIFVFFVLLEKGLVGHARLVDCLNTDNILVGVVYTETDKHSMPVSFTVADVIWHYTMVRILLIWICIPSFPKRLSRQLFINTYKAWLFWSFFAPLFSFCRKKNGKYLTSILDKYLTSILSLLKARNRWRCYYLFLGKFTWMHG